MWIENSSFRRSAFGLCSGICQVFLKSLILVGFYEIESIFNQSTSWQKSKAGNVVRTCSMRFLMVYGQSLLSIRTSYGLLTTIKSSPCSNSTSAPPPPTLTVNEGK